MHVYVADEKTEEHFYVQPNSKPLLHKFPSLSLSLATKENSTTSNKDYKATTGHQESTKGKQIQKNKQLLKRQKHKGPSKAKQSKHTAEIVNRSKRLNKITFTIKG